MNEELHADFVSYLTEMLIIYGKFLENAESMIIFAHGQYLIDPTEENKKIKDNADLHAEHLKNFIPLFLEVQKTEEKMETK
jgi:hypothetical protein